MARGLTGLEERACGAAGLVVRDWQKEQKKCDGKVEQGKDFVGIIGKLFVGNLVWCIRLEGQQTCQQT